MTLRRVLIVCCGLALALTGVPPSAASAAEPGAADVLTVETAGFRASGPVSQGGIAVLDDAVTFRTRTVNGTATFGTGVRATPTFISSGRMRSASATRYGWRTAT